MESAREITIEQQNQVGEEGNEDDNETIIRMIMKLRIMVLVSKKNF